ncbi:23S rRNA (uracil(1939)-C(5))-methyltransferase RlmD [Facilibium subflavum]|uniref:23S rRNA (uracil(1939)-C(5))-methyltransferase RlmD n=1 Tax=Facilibium subflavum TaxID=2219058 RepID=UPI000E6567F8|nr:23S rRNA (uracil(1939)-C(5))-methyltransferase RlmD [Facilibium subflavum]
MARNKLPQGQFEADIIAMSHEGRGIARIDGKTVFIPYALEGEKVKFEYRFRKKNYDEGRLVEVVAPSKKRVSAPCAYFSYCGGCSFQHLSPEDQLTFKQKTLLSHFSHFGNGLQPGMLLPALSSKPAEGYRTKARLGVRYVHKKQKVLVGFREVDGRFLADIDHCEVLHPSVGKSLVALQDLVASLSIYKEIPQIEVAVDDVRTALIIRHMAELNQTDLQKLAEFAQQQQVWIYLQSKGPETIKRFYPDASYEPTQMYYSIDDNINIYFEPNDFTQINRKMNQKMLKHALDLLSLKQDDVVLDLFCGLGNFSLPLAKRAKRVIGVEGDHAMTQRAAINAKKNNLENIAFYAADLFEDFAQSDWLRENQFDKLLLDPPRAGAENVCKKMHLIEPKRIVYVSCDPATLARDAGILVNEKGYKLVSAGVMDMFPHTTHVESIAVFDKC